MATYRSKTALTALFENGDTPSGTDFADLVLSTSVVQTITGYINVTANQDYAIGLFPDKACVITKLSVTSIQTSGSVNVIFKYGATGSSSLTSINTVSQAISFNASLTITNITLNNTTPGASASFWVTTSSLSLTPNLYWCLEYYETT